MADKLAKQKSDMRALYIHTWSTQAPLDDEPAWVNPFYAQVFGIYTIGELNTQPTALVAASEQKLELPGVNLVCCQFGTLVRTLCHYSSKGFAHRIRR
jgi:hypothetical protein